jgi:hypothetical protein
MKVRRSTIVYDPATKLPVYLNDGDEVPAWAIDKITNPEVFANDAQSSSADPDLPGSIDYQSVIADIPDPPEAATREELLAIAGRLGLTVGEHFPKSAGKDVLLAAIDRRIAELD